MRTKSILRSSAILAVTSLLLVACGSSKSHSSSKAKATKPKTSTSTTQTSAGACPGMDVAQVTQAAPTDVMYLTSIATGKQDCGDTVQFTFSSSVSAPPGYVVSYQNGPFKNAEGEPIAVLGKAFLTIRFEPASTTDLSSGSPKQTYTGSTSLHPSGEKFVQSIVKTADFEGAMTWVIGLDQKRSFKAEPGTSPSQVTLTIS